MSDSFTWSSDDLYESAEFQKHTTCKKRTRELVLSSDESTEAKEGPAVVNKTANKRQAKLLSRLQEYDIDFFWRAKGTKHFK